MVVSAVSSVSITIWSLESIIHDFYKLLIEILEVDDFGIVTSKYSDDKLQSFESIHQVNSDMFFFVRLYFPRLYDVYISSLKTKHTTHTYKRTS